MFQTEAGLVPGFDNSAQDLALLSLVNSEYVQANEIFGYTEVTSPLSHKNTRLNCDLTNVCGGVLPPISGELEVTFPAKCKGPRGRLVST